MKSYESSTVTLRAILAHPSLQRSSIDKTMEALAEANCDAREMDDAVRLGGDIALGIEDTIDDTELEREWMALVKEGEAAEKVNEAEDVGRKLEETSNVPTRFPVESPKFDEKVVESVLLS